MNLDQDADVARCILREANDGFFILDSQALRVIDVNPAAQHLTGLRRKQLQALTLSELFVGTPDDLSGLVGACGSAGPVPDTDRLALRTASGSQRPVLISVSRATDGEGRPFVVLSVRDISARKQGETAQLLETIGRLAGGVAHDFNNLLTVVNGYSDLLVRDEGLDASRRSLIQPVLQAGQRAAILTRQLLAVGRRQALRPQVLVLNQVVRNAANLLRAAAGPATELIYDLAEPLWPVEADPKQLEQVLVVLVANARDALPQGGRVIVSAANKRASAGEGAPQVCLAVSDSGPGLDEAALAHVFEPYPSGREGGRGTGLELASAYGIVAQSGGRIEASSIAGQGTTFTIFLPALPESSPVLADRKTVLIVDDENEVRALVRHVLEPAGYEILEAADGTQALRLSEQRPERIDVLVTDVLMPGMNGPELAQRLVGTRPDLRVVFMSGYVADTAPGTGPLSARSSFLEKPFLPATLLALVREALA